jgi:hypothetical protein
MVLSYAEKDGLHVAAYYEHWSVNEVYNKTSVDMDMSYARMVLTVRCKILRCKTSDLTPTHSHSHK